MTENESCDGCVMLKDNGWCILINKGKEKNCPCRACLIKVMCRTSCGEYQKYTRTSLK